MCTIKLNIFISKLNEFRVSDFVCSFGHLNEQFRQRLGTYVHLVIEQIQSEKSRKDTWIQNDLLSALLYLHLLIENLKIEQRFFS